MKTYELTFIIDAQLAPERQEEVIDKFLDLLKTSGVEILNVEKWGKKKLAYVIGDQQYGHYLMTQFKANVETIPQIERHLKLSPHVLRYLLLHRNAKTLKLMKLESERIAQESLRGAEKERPPAVEEVQPVNADETDEVDKDVNENEDDLGEDEVGPDEKE